MTSLLVLVNKKAAEGLAEKFADEAINRWGEIGIICHKIITEYRYHAEEIVRDIDLSRYKAIIAASGDGILHEVYNALSNRLNDDKPLQTLVSTLPCGSGNAFLSSVLSEYESHQYPTTRFGQRQSMIKHIPKMLSAYHDGIRVTLPNNFIRYSCLNIEFGMAAAIDSRSEWMRFLGDKRFLLESINQLVWLPLYNATLVFRPVLNGNGIGSPLKDRISRISADELKRLLEKTLISNDDATLADKDQRPWMRLEGPFVSALFSVKRMVDQQKTISSELKLQNNHLFMFICEKGISRLCLIKAIRRMTNGQPLEGLSNVLCAKIDAFAIFCSSDSIIMIDGEMYRTKAIFCEHMPKLFRTIVPESKEKSFSAGNHVTNNTG